LASLASQELAYLPRESPLHLSFLSVHICIADSLVAKDPAVLVPAWKNGIAGIPSHEYV
jgi:hypothetical protein